MLPWPIGPQTAPGLIRPTSIWPAAGTTPWAPSRVGETPRIACPRAFRGRGGLHVDRRDHVDPGVENLLDVLPALLIATARDVGVRELIDQHDRGLAFEDCVEIHFLEGLAAVLDLVPRDDREVAQLGDRL